MMKTSSLRSVWNSVLRNSAPRIGSSPSSGNALTLVMVLFLIRPPMAKLWPSISCTVVSALREISDGRIALPFRPLRVTPLGFSSETSGRTFRLMRPLPSTVGVSLDTMIYHTRSVARGLNRVQGTAWLVADLPFGSYHESKEQALRRATDFMERRYGTQWTGQRMTLAQALSWPRGGVVYQGWGLPSNAVPSQVVKACAELAFRAAGGELDPDLGAQIKSETVGPISTTYADGARQQTKYQAIDAMLGALVTGGGSQIRLVRA